MIGKPARGKTCDAILGILEEGKSIIEDYKGTISLDAGLIAAGQAVEHYEMARDTPAPSLFLINIWISSQSRLPTTRLRLGDPKIAAICTR